MVRVAWERLPAPVQHIAYRWDFLSIDPLSRFTYSENTHVPFRTQPHTCSFEKFCRSPVNLVKKLFIMSRTRLTQPHWDARLPNREETANKSIWKVWKNRCSPFRGSSTSLTNLIRGVTFKPCILMKRSLISTTRLMEIALRTSVFAKKKQSSLFFHSGFGKVQNSVPDVV